MSYRRKINWENYILWIIRDVLGVNTNESAVKFLYILSEIEYYYDISRDKNRQSDGYYLRERYFHYYNAKNDGELDRHNCSVLEVLVALSFRVEEEYIGEPGNIDPSPFFWDMIENLGFSLEDIFNKRKIVYDPIRIIDTIHEWMYDHIRTPLPSQNIDHGDDLRRAELWTQLMEYLNENY